MIQAIVNRFKRRFQLGEIDDPAGMRVYLARNLQAHHKRVSVQAAAFMAFGNVGQSVSGFEDKIFKQGGRHYAVSVLLKKPPHSTGIDRF
ncbi:hypothetical protein BN133_2291 [Cronobacter dublinensis 582]|nr:hypothetical protein BN133_2291 [Cronobacter dublinensis 582]